MKDTMAASLRTSALALMLALSACGGGGDGDDGGGIQGPQTSTGVFKDSNVDGLSYTSGGQTGVTGSDASFTYEVGEEITFKVGAVILGSSAGKALITPIDLVANGSISSIEVQNRVRFLMMLDADGDPLNGITIAESIRARAESWGQVDFSTTDLAAELATIIADARSATGGAHVLPSAEAAVNHLTATFRCVYSGGFSGTYTGGDRGRFGFLVFPNGYVFGLGYSTVEESFFSTGGIDANAAVSVDQNAAFIAGTTSSGASFSGNFTSPDEVSGTWQNEADNGSFSGSRVGGVADAQYRFNGIYAEQGGGDAGLFTFDIDGSDQVTGTAYSIAGDELIELTGNVSGTSLTGTTSTGMSFSATLNKTTGSLSGGTYTGSDGSGAFVGAGCRLN